MTTPSSPRMNIKTKIFAHVETMRPYTIFWCGLVSLIGACLVFHDLPPFRTSLFAFLIPVLGWIAGLYLADYHDRALDVIQKPHRPIPSGRLSPNEALTVGAIFALTGLVLSFFLTLNNVLLVFLVAILVFLYVKISKARGILGNFNRGVVIITAYLFGVFSIPVPLSSIPVYVWLFILVFVIHDTSSNIIGTIRDIEGDRQGRYLTLPVKYGVKTSLFISLVLSVLCSTLIIGIVLWYHFFLYPFYFAAAFIVAIVILCVMYGMMFTSLQTMDRRRALRAHELFVAERVILASAFLIGIIQNRAISFIVFLLSLGITLVAQYLIRGRYEFKERV